MNCLAGPGTDRHQRSRLAAFVADELADALIVDLGAGGFRLAPHVLNVDIGSFPEVDVVADGHALPLGNGTVARVVCTGVLEHVNFPERVVAEMHRVLRPGGRVYVAVPFLQGFHPGTGTSQDFQRYTHVGLTQLLAKFCIAEWGISGGPSAALAWILREYLALPFAWSQGLYRIAYLVAGPLTSWLRWLDVLLDRFPQARRIACGFYVIGEKIG
jgi:SAM-dependent methyltransferase